LHARHLAPLLVDPLSDTAVLSAAKRDPAGFINGLQGPVTLDEVQRATELTARLAGGGFPEAVARTSAPHCPSA